MTSFFCDEAAEDDEYNVIRDKPRFSQDKAFIEEMTGISAMFKSYPVLISKRELWNKLEKVYEKR